MIPSTSHGNIQIQREDFRIIQHLRKSLLYNNKIPWQKKNANLSDLATEAYDGAEVCELVGLFPLNSLANEFDTNSVGLNRGDRLALFKNINGIGQKKYVKNSTNCLRKTDYL